ncbi:TPA: hypothetical protein ACRR2I_004234 [Providencia rettgeri]
MNQIYSYLVIFLVALVSYIGGLLTPVSSHSKLEPEALVKESVLDLLSYPAAASFRNMSYYNFRNDSHGREMGFYCGEVFGFKNELPYGFKRFFVRTLKHPDGDIDISIPMAEKIDDMLSQDEFDRLWDIHCVKQNDKLTIY